MPKEITDSADAGLKTISDALTPYVQVNSGAKVDVVRENSAAILIRVIDSQFVGIDKVERSRKIWPYLRALPTEIQDDISALVLLTPDERRLPWVDSTLEHELPTHLS